MKKFASRAYDVTDYVTNGQIELVAQVSRGDDELIKNAYIPSSEEYEDRPDEDFALIVHHPHVGTLKKYATFDKYLSKLNIGILREIADEIPDELAKTAGYFLKKAAKFYGLDFPKELEKYAKEKPTTNYVNLANINQANWFKKESKLQRITKIAYALPAAKKYPISTKDNVQTAVNYFEKRASQFSPQEACEYTANVIKSARSLGVKIENTKLEKYAHLSSKTFNPDFEKHVTIRKSYLYETDADIYDDILLQKDFNGVTKTASLLYDADIETGNYKYWGRGIEDPVLSVFGMQKEASVKYAGKEVTLAKLKNLDTDLVDETTLTGLKSDEGLDVFESLPTPVKDELINLL